MATSYSFSVEASGPCDIVRAVEVVFTPDPSQEGGVPLKVWQAADEMFLAAVRLGGTLTGEHGIGVLKKRWLRDELGDDQFELQQQVKAVFDPLGILNPGKVY